MGQKKMLQIAVFIQIKNVEKWVDKNRSVSQGCKLF
jgi:hypothetical protein